MVDPTIAIVKHIESIHSNQSAPLETISLRIQESVDANNAQMYYCKRRDVQILTQLYQENARSCIPLFWDTTRDSNKEAPCSQAIFGRRR